MAAFEIMQESSVVQYFTEKALEEGLERGLIRRIEAGNATPAK